MIAGIIIKHTPLINPRLLKLETSGFSYHFLEMKKHNSFRNRAFQFKV